jgi:hypothetical protein
MEVINRSASDPVDLGRERDHAWFVVGSMRTHPVVVVGEVGVEYVAYRT